MSFPFDLALKIVAITSQTTEYTLDKGAKCPLCGTPNAHVHSLKDERNRYHKCQVCGWNFKSYCSEQIYYKKKGRTRASYKLENPENREKPIVESLTFIESYSILNIEKRYKDGDSN
jgi:transcription elongation factor Elf1